MRCAHFKTFAKQITLLLNAFWWYTTFFHCTRICNESACLSNWGNGASTRAWFTLHASCFKRLTIICIIYLRKLNRKLDANFDLNRIEVCYCFISTSTVIFETLNNMVDPIKLNGIMHAREMSHRHMIGWIDLYVYALLVVSKCQRLKFK